MIHSPSNCIWLCLYLQKQIIEQVIWGPQNSLLKAQVIDPANLNLIYHPPCFCFTFCRVGVYLEHLEIAAAKRCIREDRGSSLWWQAGAKWQQQNGIIWTRLELLLYFTTDALYAKIENTGTLVVEIWEVSNGLRRVMWEECGSAHWTASQLTTGRAARCEKQ